MPELPQMDVSGILGLFSIMLVSLAVFWGIHKAIQIAKTH